MSPTTQSYATHKRFLPGLHFFAFPVLGINVIVTAVHLWHAPSGDAAWQVLVALALVALALYGRWMSVRVQDRVIREEERTRLMRLMPNDQLATVEQLTLDQLLALRFAPDSEVVALAKRCLAGELTTRDQVKRAIVAWRPDHLRV